MVCPKCGAKIKKTDLSPVCKHCGAHIMYYTQEQDLAHDAKKTELEFAKARLLGAKLKTAWIGSRTAIARLILIFACAGAMFIPLYSVKISFPWWEYKVSVGIIGLYKIISDSFWTLFGAVADIGILSPLVIDVFSSFIIYILTVVAIVTASFAWLLAWLDIKKSTKVMLHTGAAGMFFSAVNTVLTFVAVHAAGNYSFADAAPMYGSIVCLVLYTAFTLSNYLILKNGQEVKLKDADRERLEIAQRIKDGEITLDELPLPVVKEEKENSGEGEDSE